MSKTQYVYVNPLEIPQATLLALTAIVKTIDPEKIRLAKAVSCADLLQIPKAVAAVLKLTPAHPNYQMKLNL